MLLQTTYISTDQNKGVDIAGPKESFNISAARLKKAFRATYLMELLRADDSMTSGTLSDKDEKKTKRVLEIIAHKSPGETKNLDDQGLSNREG